jgi:branched-chain amino acid transport system ATP-binding protein
MANVVLEARDLSVVFGGLRAVSNFHLTLEEGELVGLIGPNGAGKTTVFNLLTGVTPPTTGEIRILSGKDGKLHRTDRMKAHSIARLGVGRTFQNIRLFKNLSVLDNLRIAMDHSRKSTILDAVLRTPRYYREEAEFREKSVELLKIFELDGKKDFLARNLPYGEQRKLEIARALATRPKLLLLDEPAAGMNPQETKDLMRLIAFVRERFQLTILLIEHDMSLVMGICERIAVLDYGQTIAMGSPAEISRNPAVIKAYLGEEAV